MLSAARLNVALLLARVPLGAYFALAGFNKIFGAGVGAFADENLAHVPPWMPADFGRPFLTALPFVELSSGIFVALGLLVRPFALLQSLLLLSFIVALHRPVYIARVHGEPGLPFDTNVVLLGLTLCLVLLGAGEWGTHRAFRRRRRVVAVDQPVVATTSRGTPIVGS